MPYPFTNTNSSEIQLFYQIYDGKNSKPHDAILFDSDSYQKFEGDVIDDLVQKGLWNETLKHQLESKQLYFKVFRDDEDMIPADAVMFENVRILPNEGLRSLEKYLENKISNSFSWLSNFVPERIKKSAYDFGNFFAKWTEDKFIGLSAYSSIPKVEEIDKEEWYEMLAENSSEKSSLEESYPEEYYREHSEIKQLLNFDHLNAQRKSKSESESLLANAWNLASFIIHHPLQTLTLALAMQMLVSRSTPPHKQHFSKRLNVDSTHTNELKNSFSFSTTLSAFITQVSFTYGTSLVLNGGRHTTALLAFASLTSLFSSAAAQPWYATYPTPYSLSNLNGQSGVKFLGDSNDAAGVSVCAIGDVNGDGRDDLLIGTWKGNAAYLVYGGSWLNSPAFSLSNLDGTNGVKFLGVSTGTPYTGYSVSGAGDVNGDGKPDFLISAYNENGNENVGAGAVYLVYGSSQFNKPTFSLSTLDGENGVKLLGEDVAFEYTGYSVSAAGDVNGDGKSDFLIGAFNRQVVEKKGAGAVYLVYGGSWLNTATFSLIFRNLNGKNVVRFLGVSANDETGVRVSAAGDINGDGKSDFLIGTATGTVYLVYGGYWSKPSYSLSDLDGKNGVKILVGETTTAPTISAVGDINRDGKADFLIGDYNWNEKTGAAYLIYGGPWLNKATFSLATLDGQNGVKFLGVSQGDLAGVVGIAGDMNGDGIPDILIGASGVSNNQGMSYLIYGGSWLNMPSFPLANLAPNKGIRFVGATNDQLGNVLNFAGDINGDGATDILIGAFQANNNAGAAYLIHGFGFTLWINQLDLYRGERKTITPFMLNTTGVITSGQLNITAHEIQNGQFENIVNPGVAITSFTKYQISRSQIQFVHDGSLSAPAYMISVSADTAATISPIAAKITFTKNPLTLLNNSFAIERGQTILLSQIQFNSRGTPAYYPVNTTFTLSSVKSGYFENVARRVYPITSFTQWEINRAQIRFVHDGKGFAPSFNVTLSDPGMKLSPKAAKITFIKNPPVLVKAQLVLERAQTILLTPLQFNSTGTPAYFPNQTTFTVNYLRHGYFKNVITGIHLTSFTQGQINRGQIQFVHDGTKTAPRLNVTLFDPGMSLLPQKANIQFVQNPLTLLKNDFAIERGQTILLSQIQFNSRGTPAYFPANTTFALSNITHGYFESLIHRGYPLTAFTQWQINAAQIQFVHDGSEYKPTGNFTLFDPGMKLSSQALKINFTPNLLKLLNKGFLIERGQTILLNSMEFKSIGTPVYYPLNTTFAVSPVQYGYFENVARRGYAITSFTQWQINRAQIQFVHDGKGFAPSFNVTLFDPGMRLLPQAPNITFIQNPPVILKKNLVLFRAQTIQLTPFQFNSTGIPLYFPNQTTFIVNKLVNGRFENVSKVGHAIFSFTQYQINQAQIQFVHDGSISEPQLNITLLDPGMRLLPEAAQINFTENPLILLSHSMVLERAQTILLNPTQFRSIGTPAYTTSQITFALGNITHGYFENVGQPGLAIPSFTQYQINHGKIQFVHDGREFEPSGNITLYDPGMRLSPHKLQIIFTQNPPVLLDNSLKIERGQTVVLSSLQFNSRGTPAYFPANTTFALSAIKNGQFENVNSGKKILSFTQAEINEGQIRFVHNSGGLAPSFNVTLFDPGMTLSPNISQITFIQNSPVLQNNTLIIQQGKIIKLSSAQLASSSIPYADPTQLKLVMSNVFYGHFEFLNQVGVRITTFSQSDIDQGQVQFVPDGSCHAPTFLITLSDPGMTLSPVQGEVTFFFYPSTLSNNKLTITQGETLTLTQAQLSADTNNPDLKFIIENQVHISFKPDVFTWLQLSLGQVTITHDGSLEKPSYNVSFSNCQEYFGPWSPTSVTLNPKLPTVIESAPNFNLENTVIAATVSGGIGVGFLILKLFVEYFGKKRLKKVMEENKTENLEEIAFHKNVILPMAENIFSIIKVTGIFSDSSEERMIEYKHAVIHLVEQLNNAGIDILGDMDPLRKNALLSTIARHAKKQLVPEVACCTTINFARFFVAHASPDDIWNKSQAIAEAVKQDLAKNNVQKLIEDREPEELVVQRDSMTVPLLALTNKV